MRLRTVPVVVLVLGFLAAGALVILQQRADHARTAHIGLEQLKRTMLEARGAAFLANADTGGSTGLARVRSEDAKAKARSTLERLQAESPPPALAQARPAIEAQFARLDQIRALGDENGLDESVDRVAVVVAKNAFSINAVLGQAGDVYDARAARATRETTVGGIAVIAFLLGAFGVYYRRSVRAQSRAEKLAADNERLLVASRHEALVDALTGLRNRRALATDLSAQLEEADRDAPLTLVLFDLDGFKQYNDTFGHPAGDSLLMRLGERLQTAVGDTGTAYRMGGDEFCLLTTDATIVPWAAEALSEAGDVFSIGCSYGLTQVPTEAATAEQALQLADQRMYEEKNGRSSASRQSTDVLLKVLSERNAELHDHLAGVSDLARMTAERAGLPEHEVRRIELAAELHDVGKSALPDTLLQKPAPLTAEEWGFMREHTVIGERIVRAAPSLAHSAELVRSTHERFDGQGYPDGLRGEEIPLGSSIIAVCDAFDVMTAERPYSEVVPVAEALAELRRCAGTQFDPAVVETFAGLVQDRTGAALA